MHSKRQPTKPNKIFFFDIHFLLAHWKQPNKGKDVKNIYAYFFCFLILLLLLTFVWELFLTNFVFVWIRFIKKISTIYQFKIRKTEMRKRKLEYIWCSIPRHSDICCTSMFSLCKANEEFSSHDNNNFVDKGYEQLQPSMSGPVWNW